MTTTTEDEPPQPRQTESKLKNDLMRVINAVHKEKRFRSYCGALGTVRDKTAASSLYRNACKSDMRMFEEFFRLVFGGWEGLKCMEWARKKNHWLARTPSLTYIASHYEAFFDEVLGRKIAEVQKRRRNGEDTPP